MATYSNDSPGSSSPQPVPPPVGADDAHAAANLIRQKIARAYDEEPASQQELTESQRVPKRSKHQQFMYDLGTSGKDLAAIQTEWHDYYQQLPDAEKHEVWQEFYASQSLLTGQAPAGRLAAQQLARHKQEAAKPRKTSEPRSARDIQSTIRNKVSAGGRLQAKHHLQSLFFGLGMGALVLFIFLFGFFNQVIIAPFIQPSRTVTATPLIVDSSSVATTPNPEVIIPKINVQIPVNYSIKTTDETVIENNLEHGVIHYPTTVFPGQNGNAAFFGHSSNNIFNPGKYKFAFVLLHTLVPGDTFYLSYNGTMYVYKVIDRKIVEPNDVSVLGPVSGQTATATLITCDPPGTSLHRLVVVGKQISPSPSGNAQPTATTVSAASAPSSLPGNGPTLWTRLTRTVWGKVAVVAVIAILGLTVIRLATRRMSRI